MDGSKQARGKRGRINGRLLFAHLSRALLFGFLKFRFASFSASESQKARKNQNDSIVFIKDPRIQHSNQFIRLVNNHFFQKIMHSFVRCDTTIIHFLFIPLFLPSLAPGFHVCLLFFSPSFVLPLTIRLLASVPFLRILKEGKPPGAREGWMDRQREGGRRERLRAGGCGRAGKQLWGRGCFNMSVLVCMHVRASECNACVCA